MILTVTGHRPKKLFGYDIKNQEYSVLAYKITEFILEGGYNKFITGMALGADTVFAISVLMLKKQFPEFHLECAIPCLEHSSLWNSTDAKRYDVILKHADEVTMVSRKKYLPYLMQERNKYMVNKCTDVLAVWDGSNGGTANCVRYALKQNKSVYVIDPSDLYKPISRFNS